MKMTICGKGGCGKSTTTAMLAKALAVTGKQVLVVDSDESNFGLHRQLGLELPRDFTEYFGGKDKAFKTVIAGGILNAVKLEAFAKKFFSEDFALSDIPEEYFSSADGIRLMSSGKIHKANEGCACTMNSILEQFVQHLSLGKDEIALLDMEAGVEHFGRGTNRGTDGVLMIVDPSYESLRLAEKISALAAEIGKPVFFCLNKVTDDSRELMKNTVKSYGEILSCIPYSPEISKAGLLGQPLNAESEEIRILAEALCSKMKA